MRLDSSEAGVKEKGRMKETRKHCSRSQVPSSDLHGDTLLEGTVFAMGDAIWTLFRLSLHKD